MQKKYGLIRLACCVPNVYPADISRNISAIASCLNNTKAEKADVAVFPELSLTGATCGELFLTPLFLKACEQSLIRFLNTNLYPGLLVLGSPVCWKDRVYNAAVVCQGQKILAIIPKRRLDQNEKRWFSSDVTDGMITWAENTVRFGASPLFKAEQFPDFTLKVAVGSDGEDSGVYCDSSDYGATCVVIPAAKAAKTGLYACQEAALTYLSRRYHNAIAYCSAGVGESSSEVVYPGNIFVVEHGKFRVCHEGFQRDEHIEVCDIDVDLLVNKRLRERIKSTQHFYCEDEVLFDVHRNIDEQLFYQWERTPFIPEGQEQLAKHCQTILNIQAHALATRLEHIGCKQVVIGLSGGLDSTLALLVVLKAYYLLNLPLNGIHTITMPGFGTTGRTLGNVKKLCQELNLSVREINITASCLQHMQDIGHNIAIHDVTYENVQARERTQILMDISNKVGGIAIGTGDLSEIALGWSTYNGDHMSMYSVNCDVPKTLIPVLIRHFIASESLSPAAAEALNDIIDTPISPELLPPDANGNIQQETENVLGPYEVHDFYLYYLIHCGFSPCKVFFIAQRTFSQYTAEELKGWLKKFIQRFWQHQFKRSCSPDGPQVGSVSLNAKSDWVMGSDLSSSVWLKELEDL